MNSKVHEVHHHGNATGNEGLFISHLYLGSLLFSLGLWWWLQSLRRCYTTAKRNTEKYFAAATHASGCLRLPIGEGLTKVILSVIGMVIEAVTVSYGRDKEYAHFTFYAAFLVVGMVELLFATVIFLPDGMDFVLQILPFFFHAYCMRAQSYDQPHVTAASRMISSYLCILTCVAMFAEMVGRSHFMLSWIKCFTVMLTAVWSVQLGWILNPPRRDAWSEMSHDNGMYVAIFVAWHMFFTATFQMVVLIIYAKLTKVSSNWTDDSVRENNISELHKFDGRSNVQYTKLLTTEASD